jgi:hypothetical protein
MYKLRLQLFDLLQVIKHARYFSNEILPCSLGICCHTKNIMFVLLCTLSHAFDNGIAILTKVAQNILEVRKLFRPFCLLPKSVFVYRKGCKAVQFGEQKILKWSGGVGGVGGAAVCRWGGCRRNGKPAKRLQRQRKQAAPRYRATVGPCWPERQDVILSDGKKAYGL